METALWTLYPFAVMLVIATIRRELQGSPDGDAQVARQPWRPSPSVADVLAGPRDRGVAVGSGFDLVGRM